MKNPIYKRAYRQVYFHPSRVLPIFLALIFIIIFSSSFFTAQDSTKKLYYELIDKGRVEDGNFTCLDKLDDQSIKDLEKKNINLSENFYLQAKAGDNKTLRIFENREKINIPSILTGSLAKKKGEIALSANYARANDLKVGDMIRLERKDYKIVGLIALPDYSTLLKNNSDLVMDPGFFGVGLVAKNSLKDLSEQITYQYSYHDKEDLTKADAKDKQKDLLKIVNKKNMVTDSLLKFDNQCIRFFIEDMGGDVPMMTSLMVVLVIAIAFISAIQVKSLIEEEAPIIGTLLASGYKKSELRKSYMLMPIFITLVACLIGNIIAYTFAYKTYTSLYYKSYDLPKFVVSFNLRSFMLTSLIPLLIYLIINYLVISKSLSHKAIDFLRNTIKSPRARMRVRLDKFTFINKFRLRVLLANRLNIISLIFGIGLANILLIYSIGVKPIFIDYAEKVKNSMKYDHTYIVKAPDPNIKADKISMTNFDLVAYNMKKVPCLGVDSDSKYKDLDIKDLDKKDVIISNGLAKVYKLKVGDKIEVIENFNYEKVKLEIKSIDKSNNQFQILGKRENINKILGQNKDYFNAYGSKQKLSIDKNLLVSEIDKEEMNKFMAHFLDSFGGVFDSLLVITLAFYLIISYLVTSLIIDKSKTNISYLKVFGVRDRESTAVYTNPIFLILLVFEIIMIPVMDFLIKTMTKHAITKLDAYVEIIIPISSFTKAIALSLVIFIIVQFLEKRKISKIDMVKELKIING
ncbi:FtsX-like permease family protein [uncultured Anaerococcus sp.]|uniref:FtsX-like permease family protein n=1 Tax=uncultured Anaerococcus sp. TaxID=293428 RepID=UPI00288A9490|nr:FtsX-like permease family protein [uncultured Anaerococcus sp.]